MTTQCPSSRHGNGSWAAGADVMDRLKELGTIALSLSLLAVLWELAVRLFAIPEFLLPAPSAVTGVLIDKSLILLENAFVTFRETVYGFLMGLVLGVVSAIVIVYSRLLQNLLYPLILIAQIVPKVAIAPLLLIWVGYGELSKVLIAFLVSWFPIIVTTVSGMRMVQPEMLDLARSLQATDWQIFTKVRLPHSLPHFFGGLKIAITLAVIGAIIGEFIGGNHGLGYLIVVSNYEVNTPLMFSALIVLSLMGLMLYGAIVLLERWLIPWGIEEEEEPSSFGM